MPTPSGGHQFHGRFPGHPDSLYHSAVGASGVFSGNNGPSWVWHEENDVLWGVDRSTGLSVFAPRTLWQDTLDSLENVARYIEIRGVGVDCLDELSKLGTKDKPLTQEMIRDAAGRVKFYSGDLPEVRLEVSNPLVNAVTLNLGDPLVFWRPGQFGQSSTQANWFASNVLHELLHTLGYGDTYIQLTLLGKEGVDAKNTNNITQHLGKYCFK